MDGRQFRAWITGLNELTIAQQALVKEQLVDLGERTPLSVIESSGELPCCPHCESDKVVKNGRQDNLQTFKCKGCQKRFNRLTNTPLSGLRYKAKWQEAVASLEAKDSLTQMQERLKICRDTAHRWDTGYLKCYLCLATQSSMALSKQTKLTYAVRVKGKRRR